MLKNSFGYVYRTTNNITKQVYIGKKEGNFTHKYLGSGIRLKRVIKKFGIYAFRVDMIDSVDSREELNKLEKLMIAYYRQTLGNKEVYNLANGGDGGNVWVNGTPSLEQRLAIGKASVGNKNHKEDCLCCVCRAHKFGRKGILNPMFGKTFNHKLETIEKIKQTKAEHPYKHSAERRLKIKLANLRRYHAIPPHYTYFDSRFMGDEYNAIKAYWLAIEAGKNEEAKVILENWWCKD